MVSSSSASIDYLTSPEGLQALQLQGFFVGWPNPPSPQAHLAILHSSSAVVLALDTASNQVVGFITALSDGVLTAFIPLLEVLPAYQGRGIGQHLMQRMLVHLDTLYAVDVVCDAELQPFYAQFGMQPGSAMMLRRIDNSPCQQVLSSA